MLASSSHSLRCLQTHHLQGQRQHQSLHSSCLPFCQQSHMRTHIHERPYKGNNHLSPIIQLLDSLEVPECFPSFVMETLSTGSQSLCGQQRGPSGRRAPGGVGPGTERMTSWTLVPQVFDGDLSIQHTLLT